MKNAIRGIVRSALAGVLTLALGAPVFASPAVRDPDAVAAWRQMQIAVAGHLQNSADPRRQLVASMLLSMSVAEDMPSNLLAEAAARQSSAEAIFARVRANTNDPWILWVAVTDCRVGPQLCDADGAIDRLLRIDPHNAAVWQLALERAYRAKNTDATLVALRGMAASKRHDTYFVQGLRVWSSAMATIVDLPEHKDLLERSLRRISGSATLDRGQVVDMLRAYGSFSGSLGLPPFQGLTDVCVREASVGAHWIDACRGAADALIDSDTVLGTRIGTLIAYRMASTDEQRASLERQRLQADWLQDALGLVYRDSVDDTGSITPGLARDIWRSWIDAPSEIEATRTLLRARGMSLEPPPTYTGTGPTLAEREAERLARLQ